MKNTLSKLFIFTLLFPLTTYAVNWSKGFEVTSPRENIYELPEDEFLRNVMNGRKHALIYPVRVTELKIPYKPLRDFFESDPQDPVRKVFFDLSKEVSPFKSMEEVFQWLGLHAFPLTAQSETPNPFPEIKEHQKKFPLGATFMENEEGIGMTFGCAACHSGDLFGVKVLGLTNRFPRANHFFDHGRRLSPYVNSFLFKNMLQTTEGERIMMVKAKKSLNYVGTKIPVALGLDTSLAQVALSLSKREADAFASKTKTSFRFPRKNKLETMISDSKPAVWWNLKYKNRWLSDGSIVSGNPVHTNFLWNEIGRGTDLVKLEKWLVTNSKTVEELTAAVFATKPPRYEAFFGTEAIDIEKAKRGEKHYVHSCQRCHGSYEKGWSGIDSDQLSKKDLLQNTRVKYHLQTPVKDVGTDPGRYLGMKEFSEDLNRLQISKALGAVVEPQKGYVPPPLDGIWARWPYFHNNSIPNLCALLTPGPKRPKTYWAGKALRKERDFDQDCVGYPMGEKTPAEWKKERDYFYDSTKEGLSNMGHDERIFMKEGREIYSSEEKFELIEFLKTL